MGYYTYNGGLVGPGEIQGNATGVLETFISYEDVS